MWFKAYHEFGHGKSVDASNFLPVFNAKACKGCGLCAKRCPMEIVSLQDSDKATNKKGMIAVLKDENICIGCGVCAYKCPTKAIVLKKRPETTTPPADIREYVNEFINDFADPLPKRDI